MDEDNGDSLNVNMGTDNSNADASIAVKDLSRGEPSRRASSLTFCPPIISCMYGQCVLLSGERTYLPTYLPAAYLPVTCDRQTPFPPTSTPAPTARAPRPEAHSKLPATKIRTRYPCGKIWPPNFASVVT